MHRRGPAAVLPPPRRGDRAAGRPRLAGLRTPVLRHPAGRPCHDGKITVMTDLAANLRAVRARIDAAARTAGRDPSSVTLLAVSKTWPAADVRALAALGQRDFGENRAQELVDKAAAAHGPGRPRAALALHRSAAAQQGRGGGPPRRRRPLGRPRLPGAGARPRRVRSRAARSRCSSRLTSAVPAGDLATAGRPAPGRRPRAGRPGRRVGRPGPARPHGRRAARQ